ncbi:hypothetical protein B4U84_01755 [Westiellopsis prolifica IICB1]|nr:hypothetical protein B4U84_01755 [Westiellopsis prolifica IICB1]
MLTTNAGKLVLQTTITLYLRGNRLLKSVNNIFLLWKNYDISLKIHTQHKNFKIIIDKLAVKLLRYLNHHL